MKHLLLLLLLVIVCSCDPDPIITNEEELITTVNYNMVPQDGGETITFSFEDLDGPGGEAAIVTTGALSVNTTYIGTVELYNKAETPIIDITEEVVVEAEDHQLFFSSTISDLTVAYDDLDTNDKPIGLRTILTTGASGEGTLTITLKHKPMKSADGVEGGDIANAGGETDVAVSFSFNVQ